MARKKIKRRPVYRRTRKSQFGLKEAVGVGVGLAVVGAGLHAFKDATA